MNNKEILKRLKSDFGLCPSGVKVFDNSVNDIDRLATACVKWVELFIEHEESINLLNQLNKEQLEVFNKHGIYYNQTLKVKDQSKIILLGNCVVDVEVSDFSANQIYVLNNSVLRLITEDFSKTWIDMYHNSLVSVTKLDVSSVNVINYSEQEVIGEVSTISKRQYVKGEIFNYKN